MVAAINDALAMIDLMYWQREHTGNRDFKIVTV